MPKKITIELSDADHRRFVNAKLDRKFRSLQELMIQGTIELLDRPEVGSSPIPGEGINTPDTPQMEHGDIPRGVLQILRKYAHDPHCIECVMAIGRIWGGGDAEIKDAITRNCRVFARASDAMQQGAKSYGGSYSDSDLRGTDHETRVEEFLDAAGSLDAGDDQGAQEDRDAVERRRRMGPVGGRPARKTGGGGGNRG